jgi:hypothetical protein
VDEKHLSELEEREIAETVERSREIALRGYVRDYSDLYPDSDIEGTVAYARSLVPLPFLLLLYDNVALFVPPLDQQSLERRWGVSINRVAELARAGIVHPLIGHPVDYAGDEFAPLLELTPPSVWARGVGLLEAMSLQDTLDEQQCPLPIDAMALLPELRERFGPYLRDPSDEALTARIKTELLTNYADLWVFGQGELADALAREKEPGMVARRLFAVNEALTYPSLFGFGGTANYDRRDIARRGLVDDLAIVAEGYEPKLVPRPLNVLLQGVGIRIEDMTVTDIQAFRNSGDGALLRSALAEFEKEASARLRAEGVTPTLFDAAERLEDVIREAARTLTSVVLSEEVKTERRRIELVFRAGGVAAADLLGRYMGLPFADLVALLGGVSAVDAFVPSEWRERALELRLDQKLSPGLANLWKIAEHQRISP